MLAITQNVKIPCASIQMHHRQCKNCWVFFSFDGSNYNYTDGSIFGEHRIDVTLLFLNKTKSIFFYCNSTIFNFVVQN